MEPGLRLKVASEPTVAARLVVEAELISEIVRLALASDWPLITGKRLVVVKVKLEGMVVKSKEERLVVCSATWLTRIRGAVVSIVKIQVAEFLVVE